MAGHPNTQEPRAYILELPTEMLQRIGSFTTAETLTTMRLVCKTLEAATLDMWAGEHISRLECFILDPARLLRVDNIMSTSHLATRVRSVAFSLSAHESSFEMQLAPPMRKSLTQASCDATSIYAEEQYSEHACGIEGIRPRCWDLMSGIMAQVAQISTCSVVVDTQGEDVVYDELPRCRPQLVKEIIDAALQAGCNFEGLFFTDRYALKASHFERGGNLQHAVSGLRHFAYDTWPSKEADLQSTWTKDHWRIVEAVAETAGNLQNFDLRLSGDSQEVANGTQVYTLCEKVFTRPNFNNLVDLYLSDLTLSDNTLQRIFQACAANLEQCTLVRMLAIGEGDIYGTLFKRMCDMVRLEKVCLWNLCKRSSISGITGQKVAFFFLPGEGLQERVQGMTGNGVLNARPFLSLNLEHGVEYR